MPDLLLTLRDLLTHQYEAALSALHLAIARCPDTLWDEPVARWKFCTAAFHTVFFGDIYLQPNDDEAAFQQQPFHRAHPAEFRDYEEFLDREPSYHYKREFVVEYLNFVRQKAAATIAATTAEEFAGPSGFSRRHCTRAELHVYNIRHLQHHAAQLALRLRQNDPGVSIPWVGHAWKEV
jgi:hypothetical protein